MGDFLDILIEETLQRNLWLNRYISLCLPHKPKFLENYAYLSQIEAVQRMSDRPTGEDLGIALYEYTVTSDLYIQSLDVRRDYVGGTSYNAMEETMDLISDSWRSVRNKFTEIFSWVTEEQGLESEREITFEIIVNSKPLAIYFDLHKRNESNYRGLITTINADSKTPHL